MQVIHTIFDPFHPSTETEVPSLELTWLRGWHHLFVVDFVVFLSGPFSTSMLFQGV